MQQRWKGKAEKQYQRHNRALHQGLPAGHGELQGEDLGQPANQHVVCGKAQQTTDKAGQNPQPEKQQRMQTNQPALGHAQTAHHGAGIEMALHVAPRGQGSGNR